MIWTSLLRIRAQLQNTPSYHTFCVSQSTDGSVCVKPIERAVANGTSAAARELALILEFDSLGEHAQSLTVIARQPFEIELADGHALTRTEVAELQLYLPYALLPYFSLREKRTFAISHFAQTLDGRIASYGGDSKWIGNQENLTHAHKMRALCDAILVGTATLRADQPRLSVRHVPGSNPLRIILGDNVNEEDINSDQGGPVLVVNTRHSTQALEQLTLTPVNGKIPCQDILSALYQKCIRTIYIEGGAATTSHFLEALALDQVQVHVSPRILGSGKTGFEFDGVDTMEQAVDFLNPRFLPIGDQIMFVGEIAR